ncbi:MULTISPECIES: NucA/NucB deoxyribonuclease domain-containing protein [unclassified Curtobacterium]|uniref:NucA/NucB deoxyribonuclease domain-containing protein n=1 Tax=unclassified Curtobacterium TaxID=257496 RepID=UPI001113451F|nr:MULTISPECIES: NucA/NucB deoxyribonuclease domain-containing protein [unclassified Curtobacterium]
MTIGTSPAQAAGPYDAVTSSSLRNFATAVEYSAIFGSGNYDDTNASDLSDWGWSESGNSTTAIEMWVEGNGDSWKATARDTRGGDEYSYSSNSAFNGGSAASVRASAQQPTSAVGAAGLTVHRLSDGLDAEALAASLLAIAPSQLCDGLAFVPGTHNLGSSLTDQYIACTRAAQASGATSRSVLLAVRSSGGAAALSALAIYYVGDGTQTATAPAWTQQANPAPPSAPEPPAQLPGFWRVGAVASALTGTNPDLTPSDAQVAAKQCIAYVAAAGQNPYDECKHRPIFVSGQEDAVDEATNHDIDAMLTHPAWVLQDYRPAAENPSPRSWYSSSPACQNQPAGNSCDEFPLYSTLQGGNTASPLPSLRSITSTDNSAQGGQYGSFVTKCHLNTAPRSERGIVWAPAPRGSAVATLKICNGH